MDPLGPVELDDQFTGLLEEPGEPGAIATGPLDRPGTQGAMGLGQVEEGQIAVGIGGDGGLSHHRPGSCHHDGSRVGVLVGVDADDDVDLICQH